MHYVAISYLMPIEPPVFAHQKFHVSPHLAIAGPSLVRPAPLSFRTRPGRRLCRTGPPNEPREASGKGGPGERYGGFQLAMGVPLYRWMVFVRENPSINVGVPLWETPTWMEKRGDFTRNRKQDISKVIGVQIIQNYIDHCSIENHGF